MEVYESRFLLSYWYRRVVRTRGGMMRTFRVLVKNARQKPRTRQDMPLVKSPWNVMVEKNALLKMRERWW